MKYDMPDNKIEMDEANFIMSETVKGYIKSGYAERTKLLRESLIDGQGMINYGQNNERDARGRALLLIEVIEDIFEIYKLNYEVCKESIETLKQAACRRFPPCTENRGNVLTSKEAIELDLEKAINAAL